MTESAELLLVLAAKVTVVLGVAVAVTHVLRRRSAAERHLVWVVAVAAVLAVPVLTLALPSWRAPVRLPAWVPPVSGDAARPAAAAIAVPASAVSAAATVQAEAASSGGVASPVTPSAVTVPVSTDAPAAGASIEAAPYARSAVSARAGAAAAASTEATRHARTAVSSLAGAAAARWPVRGASLVLLVWLAGCAVLLARLCRGLLRVHRLARRARELRDPALLARVCAVAAEQRVRRRVRLLAGADDAMPITFGVLRPSLLLPSSAVRWPPARQRAVLRHELAHIRRRDSLAQLLAELACALHWYHPLVWLAARRLCVEREHACDDAVLAAGARPADYAAELLAIARGARHEPSGLIAAIALARPSQLRARLEALLEERHRRARLPAALLGPAWLGAAVLIAPLSSLAPSFTRTAAAEAPAAAAALAPAEAGQEVGPGAGQEARQEARQETGQETGQGSWTGPAPALQQECLALGARTNVSTSSNDSGRRSTTKWSGAGCAGELMVEGSIDFDPSFTTITGLSRGGLVRLTVDQGREERHVVIRPANGGLSYEYRVGGRERAWDADGQRWLSEQLLFLFRQVGFMAEERAAALLRRGGARAVLDEVELLRGDYPRATYLTVLVREGRLSESQLQRVLTLAGQTISSDHYLTGIVTAVAGNYAMTDAIRSAYISALAGVHSDHYRHVAFTTLLGQGDLSPEQAAAVLRESRRISSDHYRATLLQELGTRYVSTPALRAAYLEAAEGISSDHYKAEVLSRLLSSAALPVGELPPVIAAAARIGSDHYARTVLSLAAARADLDRSGLLALIDAADGIGSDHYRSELLIEIARRHAIEGEVRTRFLAVMEGIGSSHYRGRIADVLLRQGR